MGLGDLSDLGNIGGIIGSVLTVAISAIVLITFAPGIVADIDNIALNGTGRCIVSGEQFVWMVAKGTHTTADEAWGAVNAGTATVVNVNAETLCAQATAGGGTGAKSPTYAPFYTPRGSTVMYEDTAPATGTGAGAKAGTKGFQADPQWKPANRSIAALSGGAIAMILFSATAILVPAGGIGFLGYFGARFVAQNIGGGPLAIAIGATVIVVIAGAILPQIFEPLDLLYLALDGKRFWVYSQGLGKLGTIIGNFLGIALLGGIVTLGMLLWKGQKGTGQMSQAM